MRYSHKIYQILSYSSLKSIESCSETVHESLSFLCYASGWLHSIRLSQRESESGEKVEISQSRFIFLNPGVHRQKPVPFSGISPYLYVMLVDTLHSIFKDGIRTPGDFRVRLVFFTHICYAILNNIHPLYAGD